MITFHYKLMYSPRVQISGFFKQNQKPLTNLSLILQACKNSNEIVSFAVFDTSEINEHRVCIIFCLKNGKNATEMYAMVKTAYGDSF